MSSLEKAVADALFAYNTPQGDHFVIHEGGYEGIARAACVVMAPALDKARADADRYLSLIHQSVTHHLEQHPECDHYRTADLA